MLCFRKVVSTIWHHFIITCNIKWTNWSQPISQFSKLWFHKVKKVSTTTFPSLCSCRRPSTAGDGNDGAAAAERPAKRIKLEASTEQEISKIPNVTLAPFFWLIWAVQPWACENQFVYQLVHYESWGKNLLSTMHVTWYWLGKKVTIYSYPLVLGTNSLNTGNCYLDAKHQKTEWTAVARTWQCGNFTMIEYWLFTIWYHVSPSQVLLWNRRMEGWQCILAIWHCSSINFISKHSQFAWSANAKTPTNNLNINEQVLQDTAWSPNKKCVT